MCEEFALLPQILTSCCGVGNVTCVKRAGMVSCFAKCLLKLELIDGPGVIPKRGKEKEGMGFVSHLARKPTSPWPLECSAVSASVPAWKAALQGERPDDIYRLC